METKHPNHIELLEDARDCLKHLIQQDWFDSESSSAKEIVEGINVYFCMYLNGQS